jgi:hypothetical protein
MIPYVGEGLTQPRGNLDKGVAFEKVQPERLALIRG